MTALPSVEPLSPGTRPTEPGWYITAMQEVVEVWPRSHADQTLVVAGIMWEKPHPLSSFPAMEFIARLYPDRIGQQ